ncbi:MAG: pitrilysin family protein [Gemmatimonadaceae bacterium]|nr:pitrilysin family protein [Gemmatimonadaceae bacterium]
MHIPIETYHLPNGLRVTLSEDHTAPIVAVNLWYRVGSANERAGRTGFAHLFEHMLFQGSANVGANEHFELVQRAGGTLNGSTWLDRTNYFETVPSHQLALALWLEADRMARLLPAMTQEKLDTQRSVVKNERLWSMDNQPYGTWWEKLPALAFPPSHPYHHSLIGSMEDLDAASLDDVAEFFRTWYTPDNAVLTIAGDFDPGEAKRLVEAYYGPIPRGRGQPALPSFDAPASFGPTPPREVVPDDVPAARVIVALRSPVFGSDGWYDAQLTAAVLGARRGSRLYRGLVRTRQIAVDVGAYTFDLSRGSDLLVVDITGAPGVSVETLEHAVHAQLDALQALGVDDAELARAQALVETDLIRALQSAGTRADRLSQFATYLGDPHRLNGEPERYRAVTTERVNAFAKARCGRDNRAVLAYVPRETSPQATAAEVSA